MRALALTDTDGLYGAVPFFAKARQVGISPILGVELRTDLGIVTCLVRDRTGYRNLCRLTTRKRLAPDFDIVREVTEHQEGLYILTASPRLLEALAREGDLRPGTLFAELIRYPACRRTPARSSLAQERAAARLRLPVVATNHVAFADPDGYRVHRILTAVRLNRLLADVGPADTAHPEAWLKEPAAMAALFRDRPDALRRTVALAESCDLTLESERPVFPTVDLAPGETPFSRLWKRAFAGAARRYRPLTPGVIERLRRELSIINDLGFAEYFLIMHDVVRFARRNAIPAVGRGSAADSLVAYCLGISAVDPIAHDLCFERFLNRLRADFPDIDMDFCWRRRDEVIAYLFQKYGAERVAMVANHNCYNARSAFRDVARVLGLPVDEVNRLCSVLPYHHVGSIREAVRAWPEARAFPIDREPCRTLVALAERLDGFPRHLSVHVGGMVIADTTLTDYLPIERSAKGPLVCQYDKEGVAAVGLVKMDILAQRSLSIVSDTARRVEANRGVRVRLEALPAADPPTARLLERGGTIGCFQIESPGMRSLLRMMQARDRRDVIHALSLIRPGPSASGMKERFVRRRRGVEPVRYLHPRLAEVLGETYGVMLYQEDILRVAAAVAGFHPAEGDALRREIKNGADSPRLEDFHRRFLRGAVARGGDPERAEELWNGLRNFAAYSYCKAHAATYGYISYQAAWLKAHYPAEFLASVLANAAGFYEPREYIEEARRLGVRILPPDVNRSEANFAPDGHAIRVGLSQVKGLSQRAVRSLLAARRELPFASLADFLERTPLARPEAENLALCGALACFDVSRPQALWQVQVFFKEAAAHRRRRRRDAGAGPPGGLFGGDRERRRLVGMLARVPPLREYPLPKRLALEQQLLGLTVSDHPLAAYAAQLRRHALVPSVALARHAGRRVTVAGWLVATRRAVTQRHEFMRFLTLEDRHGTLEVVLFPDAYQRWGAVLNGLGPYLVRGRVEVRYGAVALTGERIENLSPPRPRPLRRDAADGIRVPDTTRARWSRPQAGPA